MDFKEERIWDRRVGWNEYTGRGGSGRSSGKSAFSNSISGNDYDPASIRRWRNNFFVSKLVRIRFPRGKKKKEI